MEKTFLERKEKEVVDKFVRLLKHNLKGNLVHIWLFGSKVKGNFTPDSDIDLLLITRKRNLSVEDKITDLLFELDPYFELKITPVTYSLYEYRKNISMGSPFFLTVKREGIKL